VFAQQMFSHALDKHEPLSSCRVYLLLKDQNANSLPSLNEKFASKIYIKILRMIQPEKALYHAASKEPKQSTANACRGDKICHGKAARKTTMAK